MMKSPRLVFTMLLCSAALALASTITTIEFFPADFQGGHLNMNEGNFVPLKTTIFGNGWALDKLGATHLDITVPDFLQVCGASPTHPLRIEAFPIVKTPTGARIELSRQFVQHGIRPEPFWMMGMNIYFKPTPGSAGKNTTLKFQILGGDQLQYSKTISITVVPPLPKANRMKRFRVGHWDLHSIFMPFPEIFDANLKFWTDLCHKPTVEIQGSSGRVPKPYLDKIFKECFTFYGMFSQLDTPCAPSSYGFFSNGCQITRPGVPHIQDANGNELKNAAICPQYLINDPENLFWEKHIPEGMAKNFEPFPKMTAWCIDYESYPEHATCDECRKAFAQKENLPAVPSRDDIKPGKPLNKKWRRFRADQRTQIIARLSATMKKNFPDMKLRMCTVPITDDDPTSSWSAIDTKAMDPYVDEFQNMVYCSGKQFFDILEKNVRELTKPQCPLIDPAEQLLRYFNRYTPAAVQQNILATAAFGCPEICLYPIDYYDADYLNTIVHSCNAIEEAEDAYAKPAITDKLNTKILNTTTIQITDKGKTADIPYPNLLPDFRKFLHTDGKNTFATLFNFSQTTPIILSVALPDYKGKDAVVTDIVQHIRFKGLTPESIRSGFLVKLPPNGTAVLKFADSPLAATTVSQKKLQSELADALNALKANADIYTPHNQGNTSTKWILYKGAPAIQLSDCSSSVVISPKRGAAVTAWTAPGFGTLLDDCANNVCQLGEFIPYKANSALPSPIPFNPVELKFVHGHPTAVLSFTIQPDIDAGGDGNPLESLEIRREIVLKDWYGTFALTDTLINHSKKTMELGFRHKHIPSYSWQTARRLRYKLADGSLLPLDCQSYLLPGNTIQWEALGEPKPIEKAAISFGWGTPDNFITLDAKDFVGFYTWSGDHIQTFEPFSPMFTLKPGETRSFTTNFISNRSVTRK